MGVAVGGEVLTEAGRCGEGGCEGVVILGGRGVVVYVVRGERHVSFNVLQSDVDIVIIYDRISDLIQGTLHN